MKSDLKLLNIMTKTRYTNAPKDIGKSIDVCEIMEDFLPSPEKLVFKEDNVKVTHVRARKR